MPPPDLLRIDGQVWPVVAVEPLPEPVAVRRMFDASVFSESTVAGGWFDAGRPRGWRISFGDRLTEEELDTLQELLESAGYRHVGGLFAEDGMPDVDTTCSVQGEIQRSFGQLRNMGVLTATFLARYPGPPDGGGS